MNRKKFKKLITKFSGKDCPVEADWCDVCDMMESMGFDQLQMVGSHGRFFHQDLIDFHDCHVGIVTIPTVRGRKVKKIYLKKIVLKYYQVLLEYTTNSYKIL